MQIDRLVLVNYKRFRLRQIHRLDYKPNTKTQVILGSNGSGKSSLMEELSPLPANSKDFLGHGGKEIWITHQGHSYYLASLFTAEGNRFIFEMDGENLNHGLTVTGYRDLVKSHFNYTKEIHSLLTGKTCFHALSVNDRRNWLMALSDVDYDYAAKYYKRLKDRQRDLAGALKRTQERLTQELDKQLNEAKENELRALAEEHRAHLTYLLNCKPGRDEDRNYTSELQQVEQQLNYTLGQLQEMLDRFQTSGLYKTDSELESERQCLSDKVVSIQQEMRVRYETTMVLQQKLGEFKGLNGLTLESITEQLSVLAGQIQQTESGLCFEFQPKIEDASTALSILDHAQDYILGLTESLAELPERDFHRDAYSEVHQLLMRTQTGCMALEQTLGRVEVSLRDFEEKKSADEIACPKCNHYWQPNYDKFKHEAALKEKQVLVAAISVSKAEIDRLSIRFEMIRKANSLKEDWSRFCRGYPLLVPVWQYMEDQGILNEHPTKTGSLLNALRIHFMHASQLQLLKAQQAEALKTKQFLEEINQSDKENLEKQLVQEDLLIANLQRRLKEAQEQHEIILRALELRQAIQKSQQQLINLHQDRTHLSQKLIVDQIRKAMDEAIYNARMKLSEMERRLAQIDIHRGLIQSLEKEVTELKIDVNLLGIAAVELSPTTGLIAKGMTAFINSFIDDINAFIARIWLYPLELAHIELNEDEDCDLDYKFEIMVNGEKVSGDINETSAGMKEIIDLAFVIVSMRYLKLEGYPVFLDEFAVKMDSAHRSAAYRIIDYLTESDDFSQLFLISHYENGYSNLSNAELLVLCSSNVVLPAHLTYNAHAVMA